MVKAPNIPKGLLKPSRKEHVRKLFFGIFVSSCGHSVHLTSRQQLLLREMIFSKPQFPLVVNISAHLVSIFLLGKETLLPLLQQTFE